MVTRSIFIVLCFNIINLCSCVKSYYNYTLFRAIPVNEEQISYFEDLPTKYDAQIWRTSGTVMKPVEFTISPKDKKTFLSEANKTKLYLTTIHSNVQKLFNRQTVKTYIRRRMSTFDWFNYYRVDDIYAWLQDLTYLYPKVMNIFPIGVTVQNRTILAVKILHGGSKGRSTVIVEGGVHAREWISVSFVTFLIKKLIHAPDDPDKEFKDIAFSHKWILVPVLNPDGYEYTHTEDRLWRKNCNKYGVDINRNFDVAFGTVGVSHNERSDIYCGPKAFSERESSAMADLVQRYKDNLEYFIAFHSYGQYLIIPYAYKTNHEENFSFVRRMGIEAINNIRKRFGTSYTVGTAYDTVGYVTSGVSGCWVKKTYSTPYVVTFELRDDGAEGFALSPYYILPTCRETIDGLKAFLNPATLKLHGNIPQSDNCCSINIFSFVNFVTFIILFFDYFVCYLLYIESIWLFYFSTNSFGSILFT